MGRHRFRAVEILRQEYCLEQWRDFVVRLLQLFAERQTQFGRKVLANEKAVHLARNVFAGDRLRQDQIDDVDAVEAALLAEEGFGRRIVFFRRDHEI